MGDTGRAVKRVALVCHSDLLGGAAVVTYRLMGALRSAGIDARMVVLKKLSTSENVAVAEPVWRAKMAFLGERLRIFAANGFSRANLFKVSIANLGMPLWKHPWIREADVVNLNWINQGLLSLEGIRRIAAMGKPVVWTMHDMWCTTGICHHAHECRRFREGCGKCYLLNSQRDNDLSHSVFQQKLRLYREVPIRFVAVSNWLADSCQEGGLMTEKPDVIPNAFDLTGWKPERLSNETRRIVMGAARLDDPIKDFPAAIEALNRLYERRSDVSAVFYGVLRDVSLLERLKMPYRFHGRISDVQQLREVYAGSDIVLSSSKYETLPGTLIEGMAAGCVPVAFNRGGQADIVDHLKTGYLAQAEDIDDLTKGLFWALDATVSREAQHAEVAARFSAEAIAARYISLYTSLINRV